MRFFKLLVLPILFVAISCSGCKNKKTEYYPNGLVKSEIEYRFGKEHGQTIYYHDYYQKPTLVISMKNGKRNGKLNRYYFNGNIEAEAFFVDDVQEGKEVMYTLTGDKIMEVNYLHGKKNGPYITWHERDMIREQGAFVDDMYDGDWIYYDERGFLVGEATFSKGSGTQTGYDQSGNLLRTTHYENNMKNGEEFHFSPSGDTIKIVTYEDDRIIKINNEEVAAENMEDN